MNFLAAVKILIFVCSEQESGPKKMILREIVSMRLEIGSCQEVWSDNSS